MLFVGAKAPEYSHPGDAGADLAAAEAVTLAPGERATVGTGVSIALPNGFVGFVVPRSGLAARHGITIVNSPGTVDAGYRGEIKVLLINHDLHEVIHLSRGDRIAQLAPFLADRTSLVNQAVNAFKAHLPDSSPEHVR